MPELPEVETIKRELINRVEGTRINDVTLLDSRLLRGIITEQYFLCEVRNQKITYIDRRGKYILFHLTKRILGIHLGMTGRFELLNQCRNHQHLRATIYLDCGVLHYYDVRRFGKFALLNSIDELNLGVDPLTDKFLPDVLKEKLYSGKKIKELLLDQSRIAGLGNIYTDEVLWLSEISPLRKGFSLKEGELERLFFWIPCLLEEAIKYGGTTIRDYLNLLQQQGNFSEQLKVYGREGKKCFRCLGTIRRLKIFGRSTYFCPLCQN